ncbi:hypothetical protein TNCV_2871071 [Trichonephila clavipes]|nr:hypothetical protein TNCV_2871071 [Trichonephila clavipes]
MAFKYNFKIEVAEMCRRTRKRPGAPRKAAEAHFRLLTEHDCLRSHLCSIDNAISLEFALCNSGQPMTAKHLIGPNE